jgi:hypothetical protein
LTEQQRLQVIADKYQKINETNKTLVERKLALESAVANKVKQLMEQQTKI